MPDSDRQYYSSQPTIRPEVKPGSLAAFVEIHLDIFRNTRHLMQGEPHVDTAKQVERLERIGEMLFWNAEEIRSVNEALNDRNSFYNLFNKQHEGRDRLRILHHQRGRWKRIWNWQLEKMKM